MFSLICLIPLLLILFNSMKDKKAAAEMNLKLPAFPIQFQNYMVVIEKGKLVQSFLNSFTYSAGSVILCVFFASLAAYVLSRNHLNNTKLGIILLYTAMQLPFMTFLIHGFVAKVPVELDEAAIIDGCGPVKLFFSVVLPLLKPAVATSVVLTFLNTWNEFTSPLYFLNSTEKWPMTLSVYNFFGMYFKDWNLVCADILLTSLPVIIVYLLGQKYIVAGMTSGAVKG